MADAGMDAPASCKPSINVNFAFAALLNRVRPQSMSSTADSEPKRPRHMHRRLESQAISAPFLGSILKDVAGATISSYGRASRCPHPALVASNEYSRIGSTAAAGCHARPFRLLAVRANAAIAGHVRQPDRPSMEAACRPRTAGSFVFSSSFHLAQNNSCHCLTAAYQTSPTRSCTQPPRNGQSSLGISWTLDRTLAVSGFAVDFQLAMKSAHT